tara:strand:+ start:70672 stop:71922 length:1251 start_codon:yes stop_codon:yes gene_type:complete
MVKAITCPSCGGSVSIKFAEQSLSCVCPSCLTVISNDNESVSILVRNQKNVAKPIIPLGQRFHFRGHDWEVIGFLLRSDKTEVYKWSEYLLFNPYVGYRFLVCMDGHWSYVTKTKSAPKVDKILKSAEYLGNKYSLFHKGQVKTLFVMGEFYWRVKANETVRAVDYIRPPEMLSLEKDSDEEIWSIGEYVPRGDIETAFHLKGLMPLDMGVAPHQPSPHGEDKKVAKFFSYLLCALVLIQLGFVVAVNKGEALSVAYAVRNPKGLKLTTQSFEILDRPGYIESELIAQVSNDWFETVIEAVDEESGEEYEFDQGVEYYWGSDSDGAWTEGSQKSDRRIAKLPPGKYHLNITTDSGSSNPVKFAVTISEGNISWGNFFFAILLVSIFPIYYFMRAKSFEKSRWSQSDYSPFWSQHDD